MQTERQWMVTHEWMVKGTRQTEWIEKRGILLWLAEYAGGLGAGLYIVSLLFNNFWGMVAGFLIVSGLKGGLHILYLGKPMRFWRMVMHPQTSWMSRGLAFVIMFMGFGFLQIMLSAFLQEQTTLILVFEILAGIFALCVATYTGFVMNYVKGIPFWNLPILPLLFIISGILGGLGITVLFGLYNTAINLEAAELWSRILLIVDALLLAFYLFLASRKETVGKQSVLFQLRGSISPIFWVGVVMLGIIVPAIIAVYSVFAAEIAAMILIAGIVCEVIGHIMVKYCILKSGIYNPIIVKKQS